MELSFYDQTSNAGTTAIVSQHFEAGLDTFDSQVADDFVVPLGQTWTVERVNVTGLYFSGPGPAASVNVTFYLNSGALPGAALPGGTYTNLPMTDTAGNFGIPLPSNLVLTSGTYWVSVQANMDFSPGGEWGWVDRTVQSNSAAAWQNPGGGFGFGCLTWGARGVTCGIDPTTPDQIFQIVGCLGAPSPTPIPTDRHRNTDHDIWHHFVLLQSSPWPRAKCDAYPDWFRVGLNLVQQLR